MKITELGMVGVLLAALVVAGNVRADDGSDVATVPEYLEFLAELREGFANEDPWPLSKREQRMFDEADRNIRRLLSGRDSIDGLSSEQSIALYNSQQQIRAILTGEEDTRIICRRVARTGSHMRQTRCVSAELHQAQREEAHDLLRRSPNWWREPGVN